MFTIPGWDELGPLEFLILRVCSPAGVFTTMGEGAFRAKVLEKDNQQLYQLADIAFGLSDFDFLMRLPEELMKYQSLLKTLMRKAYDHNIRVEDPRVFG